MIEFTKEWFLKAKIDLHLDTVITSIDTNKKTIIAKKKDNSFVEQKYDSLIIATGSNPTIPPIKNITNNQNLISGIFTIRTIYDAQKVLDFLQETTHATVVGAGLIGLEMADCLFHKRKKVTIVEALPHILPMLDEDISRIVEDKIQEYLTLYANHYAMEIKANEQ